MKRYYLIHSFFLIFFSGFAQKNSNASEVLEYNQMLEFLATSKRYMSSNADSMKYNAEKAFDLSKGLEIPDTLLAIIISNFVLSLIESGSFESVQPHLINNLEFLKETQHLKSLSSFYTSYGTYYLNTHQPEKAIEWYFKSYEIDSKVGDRLGKAKSLVNIALIQKRIGQYEDALANFMNGLKLCEEINDQQMVLRILVNITGFYNDRTASIFNVDSAITFGRKSVQLSQELNFTFGEAMSSTNLSAALMTKNLKQLESESEVREGLAAAIFAREFFESTNFTQQFHNSLLNEGLGYELLGDLQKATNIANELINSPFTALLANEMSYRINKKSGNLAEALKAHERFKFIQDSLSALNQQNQLAELETKYETATKDAEIISLSQEKAISELELQQKNIFIFIVLIVSVLLFIVLYLFYQQRVVRQKQQHTELEQRFLRSQLNPHFIFNALASIQNFMLKNSAQEAAMYLAKFSKLMRQILENSREEFIPVEEEIKMLKNYMDVHQLNKSKEFTYEVMVDDKIDAEFETIPPMFVQPFVENAIEHGLTEEGTGHIKLFFFKKDKFIQVEISDNGKGVSASHSTSEDHKSLSTQIIRERIDLFNMSLKDKIQFSITDIMGEESNILGTKVVLNVPFSYI